MTARFGLVLLGLVAFQAHVEARSSFNSFCTTDDHYQQTVDANALLIRTERPDLHPPVFVGSPTVFFTTVDVDDGVYVDLEFATTDVQQRQTVRVKGWRIAPPVKDSPVSYYNVYQKQAEEVEVKLAWQKEWREGNLTWAWMKHPDLPTTKRRRMRLKCFSVH